MSTWFARHPRAMNLFPAWMASLLRRKAAEQHVARGRALLSQGRVVLTDRLHGHILCVLLDIPHVLLDNSHGKVSNFHVRWTRDCRGVVFASDASEALEGLQELNRDLGVTRDQNA